MENKDDGYTFLVSLIDQAQENVEAALGVAGELVRDKMLNSTDNLRDALARLELTKVAINTRRFLARPLT